jgi:two-component system, chemotaxis family, protein-glutamate methylesterase/glutaminase
MPRKKKSPSPARATSTVSAMEQEFGAPTALTCPECGGALWQIEQDALVRYRCHVGHRFTEDSLDSAQRETVDEALWSAVRVLEEHADLRLRMAQRAGLAGLREVSKGFSDSASVAHEQAQSIRDLLLADQHLPQAVGAERPAAPRTVERRRTARERRGRGRG